MCGGEKKIPVFSLCDRISADVSEAPDVKENTRLRTTSQSEYAVFF